MSAKKLIFGSTLPIARLAVFMAPVKMGCFDENRKSDTLVSGLCNHCLFCFKWSGFFQPFPTHLKNVRRGV